MLNTVTINMWLDQAWDSGNAAKTNNKDVEHLLQKIDRVEAAINSAEAVGKAAKNQLEAELHEAPKCVLCNMVFNIYKQHDGHESFNSSINLDVLQNLDTPPLHNESQESHQASRCKTTRLRPPSGNLCQGEAVYDRSRRSSSSPSSRRHAWHLEPRHSRGKEPADAYAPSFRPLAVPRVRGYMGA